jgi:hypothetical protein
MRTSQWTLLVTCLMFVASIWFVLASARTPVADGTSPAAAPVASVRELMTGLVAPAAATVYRSVGYVVSAEGEKETSPKTDEEWDAVAGSAAAIAEAGALLKTSGREGFNDSEGWQKFAQDMIDTSLISRQAAVRRDKQALFASGEALNQSCEGCHSAYDMP